MSTPCRLTVDDLIQARVAELLAVAPPISETQRETAVRLLANTPALAAPRVRKRAARPAPAEAA